MVIGIDGDGAIGTDRGDGRRYTPPTAAVPSVPPPGSLSWTRRNSTEGAINEAPQCPYCPASLGPPAASQTPGLTELPTAKQTKSTSSQTTTAMYTWTSTLLHTWPDLETSLITNTTNS
ncbi:hypothetical protein GE061_001591 [Apolygus lucorum]|uniref:Uncharacterized protein n=1 Tax=Apolygus lucorum TaxID=248454 RepID=A0A8S9Y7H9_APOLU|nr:hypothetical protein GE061_001591 [Apolygus lucorum]